MEIETAIFADDGRTPNHPSLPLVIFRATAACDAIDPAEWYEATFPENGWSGTWRWGVYPFDHFHSTNHEVLGVARGNATLRFGGENGQEFGVRTGDVVILPAGTGHRRMEHSDDFLVVGAYPHSEVPDLLRAGEGNIREARERIAKVKPPAKDPVFGPGGPLAIHWNLSPSDPSESASECLEENPGPC